MLLFLLRSRRWILLFINRWRRMSLRLRFILLDWWRFFLNLNLRLGHMMTSALLWFFLLNLNFSSWKRFIQELFIRIKPKLICLRFCRDRFWTINRWWRIVKNLSLSMRNCLWASDCILRIKIFLLWLWIILSLNNYSRFERAPSLSSIILFCNKIFSLLCITLLLFRILNNWWIILIFW